MKNGENYNDFSRRKFLKITMGVGLLAFLSPMIQACKHEILKCIFRITGANHILGHRLWTKDFPKPTETIAIPLVIVGAGISGLSAGRQLKKKYFEEFKILELEDFIGGNSSFKENKFSKFPIAAHYIPLPNPHDLELISFLQESKIITEIKNNIPVFDEAQLCSDPHERLFIKNCWQEDLIPRYGNDSITDKEFERFFKLMQKMRNHKGKDDKFFFDIPIKNCSTDLDYRNLDALSMKDWLLENQFQSEELMEYVNYCCRDDFGLGIENLSAWAGVFYFCARKNEIYNNNSVLTWPEGNGRLMKHLSSTILDKIEKKTLVYDIKETDEGVEILAFQSESNKSIKFVAQKVICASPQYVNAYLIKDRKKFSKIFEYAPWFTATIAVKDCFYNDNLPLSWDNVIYKGSGLGYVFNQNQRLDQILEVKVLTYYYSFASSNTVENRKKLYQMKETDFKKIILEDLCIAHPSIEDNIIDIQIYRLGHGMISPKPNFMFHPEKEKASKSVENKIYFAHSDLSGISIFEEAFHKGIDIANEILDEKILDS